MVNLLVKIVLIALIASCLLNMTDAGPVAYAACLAKCMSLAVPTLTPLGGTVACPTLCLPAFMAPTP
ncbi:hypothetical protein I4U23_022982 [Adineta vaga]|nr:hypothetical protein I4U23_022982 [Adineta vaga]